MIEPVLSLLGIAKKAGRVEIGEEPVGAAARAKKARVILVAADAGPSSQRRAFSFAESGACLCLTVPADKDALGRALGRSSVAMCAVTEIGLAGAIVKKLSAMDAEKYGAASAQLDVKARRSMARRAFTSSCGMKKIYGRVSTVFTAISLRSRRRRTVPHRGKMST